MVNSITKCFIGVILSLGLCSNHDVKQTVSKKADSIINTKTARTATYLEWDSVKLNGKIPLLYSFKKAEETLGKVDSIITPNYEYSASFFFKSENFKYCYFKGIMFERSNDTLIFSHVNFEKDQTAYFGNDHMRLSYTTTLRDLKKVFPNAVVDSLTVMNMGRVRLAGVAMSKKEIKNKWLFIFNEHGSKLLRIDYWIPD